MKRLYTHGWAKLTAFFLAVILILLSGGCAVGVIFASIEGCYDGCSDFFDSEMCQDMLYRQGYDVVNDYLAFGADRTVERWSEGTNLLFTLSVEGENPVGTLDGANSLGKTLEMSGSLGQYAARLDLDNGGDQREFTLTLSLSDPLTNRDSLFIYRQIFDFVYSFRSGMILLLLMSAVGTVLLLCFLCAAAGHREGNQIVLNYQDRVPLDLYLALDVAAIVLGVLLLDEILNGLAYQSYLIPLGLGLAAVCAVAAVLLLALLLTCATRIKVGGWWKNTVTYFVLRLIWKAAKWLGSGLLTLLRAVPMFWRTGLIAGVLLFVNFLLVADNGSEFATLICFLGSGAVWLLLCAAVWQMQRLKKAGEKLAAGEFDYKIDTKWLYFDFKNHALKLNSIGEGMALAVEQRIKSERLKAELITNVSHDIKTPLTSIVNYVDLLSKEQEGGRQAEYIQVLQRQSARLKKLTEDLVEASKASTGNISVTPERLNLCELAEQVTGEYGERLAAAGVEAVLSRPDSPVWITADGRLLWRVIDNLLSNVCKYALSGTRCYIDILQQNGSAVISIKNISRQQLNIDVEELTERFVRGDAARSTEGSGLGLNIARSLTELQGGQFGLRIDGDLFKAELSFPLSGMAE